MKATWAEAAWKTCRIAVLIGAILMVARSYAQTSRSNDLLISAEHTNRNNDVWDLRGNVQLIFHGKTLTADRAIVNTKNASFHATGGVVIVDEQAKMEGQEVVWNYEKNTGTIYYGFVESGQLYFEGEMIEKVGDQEFIASHADFTGCITCPPTWNFSGNRIRAELGGYAHIRSATFRLGNFPVLWFPYLVVPIKTQRQSGFLPPDFQLQGGAGFGESFFWAISDSQDATLSALYYNDRGLKEQLEYRYVLSPDSKGILNAAYIHDKFFHKKVVTDTDSSGRNDPDAAGKGIDRWFVNYDHTYELPDDFTQKTKINLVSDLRYPQDFNTDISGIGDPALENRVTLTHNTEFQHYSLDADYYVDMLQIDPLITSTYTVHRLPTLKYAISDTHVLSSPLLFSMNFQYDNFVRQGAGHDTISITQPGNPNPDCLEYSGQTPARCVSRNQDATFHPGQDIIRTGQRFFITPKLALPLRAGRFLNIVPSATFNHTQYAFGVDPAPKVNFDQNPTRDFVRADVSARTEFSRVFGDLTDPNANRYKHSFQPELFLSNIPWLNQTNNEFFGQNNMIPAYHDDDPITNFDFFKSDPSQRSDIQFDYYDRVYDRNIVGINLNNFLTRKTMKSGAADYFQIAQFSLSEIYDFEEAKKPRDVGRPWSDARALLDIRLPNFETNSFVRYFPYQRVTDIDSRIAFLMGNKYISLNYTEAYIITESVVADPYFRQETLSAAGGLNTTYFNLSAGVQYDLVHRQYMSWLAQLDLRPPGNCLLLHFGLSQPIANGTTPVAVQFSFNFNFDGHS